VKLNLDEPGHRHTALPAVWARSRIASLSDLMTFTPGGGEYANDIRTTALAYGLMSQFTSFVAVDSSRKTDGEFGTTVPVAVPVPAGVQYETTVPEKK
jgi:Ca-activated chloride channel family protein